MTVKAANEKIAQAVKGQAAARQSRSVKDAANIVAAKVGVGPRKPTAKEQLTGGIGVPKPAHKPSAKAKGKTPRVGSPKPKATAKPKVAKVKVVTVLPDPIENQALIRMRAKWAAQRAEVVVARLETKRDESVDGSGTFTDDDQDALNVARAKAEAAWKIERQEMAKLQEMRAAAKAVRVEVIEDEGVGGGLQTVHPGTPETSSPYIDIEGEAS